MLARKEEETNFLFLARRPSPFWKTYWLSTPRLAGRGRVWAKRFWLLLALRQEGGIVREILKIGMDQHPCGYDQLMGYVVQHSNPFFLKTGRFSQGHSNCVSQAFAAVDMRENLARGI